MLEAKRCWVSGSPLGVDDDDLPVARRGDAVGEAVERDGLAGPWRADHERRALQSRQRHEDASFAVWEDVVVRDVVTEVEGRVDLLARFVHSKCLARFALGLAAGALGVVLVALAQLLDGAATQQRDRQRDRESERCGEQPPRPDVGPRGRECRRAGAQDHRHARRRVRRAASPSRCPTTQAMSMRARGRRAPRT